MRKKVGPQNAENRIKERNRDQPDDNNIQRTQGAAGQHLVDDDLKEQRRDQREQLEKERSDEDLTQQIAVFVDGLDEPVDAKTVRKLSQADATGHQNQTAIPDSLELLARHQRRPRRHRILNKDPILAGLAEQEITAIAQHGDAGQRCFAEPLPVGVVDPGFQPQFFGTTDHFRDADGAAEAMANLLRCRRRRR